MTSDQRLHIRTILKNYIQAAENNRGNWHYSQFRPVTSLGDAPGGTVTTDCSGYCISAFRWADIWLPYLVKDPGGLAYSGYGNTGSILATNRKRRVPLDHRFFIGDMALYGTSLFNTEHVTICKKNGDYNSAIFSSHGSELGPYPTYLRYRPDLLLVVRSEALA
jgi:hypothetical protein